MQFNQIHYFLRACDTLNFTQAAEQCGISQPTLSAAIQKLEDELGGALFIRQGRHMVLTPLGAAMRVDLSQVEEAKNAANRAAQHILNGQHESIDIGLMCTLSPERVLTAIANFVEEYSQVELIIHDIRDARTQELLLTEALECVIMAHTQDLPERFIEYPLIDEPMVLAMNESHSLCKNEFIQLSDLSGMCYVDRLRCEFRESFFKEIAALDIQLKTVMRSEREDLVKESILKGIGVTMMPKSAAKRSDLQICEVSDLNVVRKIGLVVVKERELTPAMHRFIQLTRAAYENY